MLRTLVFTLTLALTFAGAPNECQAVQAGVFDGLTGPILAQNRRRRRRRGRRSRPPQPPKPKTDKKDDKKKTDKESKTDKKDAKKKKKKGKKKKAAKSKRRKKAAPKVSKPKGPFLPKNFGRILMLSGSGVAVLGLGVAAWGANVHNQAISERHRLQAREANTANQMQAFYDLHEVTETGKLIHLSGLGLAGVAALAAAVGSIL